MLQVLCVDDNEDFRYFFRDSLAPLDCDVLMAGSKTEGIEVLTQTTPNIAFIDFNMPGGTGADLIRYIRQNRQYDDMKVVVVTANALSQSIVEELGIDLFLEKPVSHYDLLTFAQRLTNPA
jgi:CheY-like chemotaxis protein